MKFYNISITSHYFYCHCLMLIFKPWLASVLVLCFTAIIWIGFRNENKIKIKVQLVSVFNFCQAQSPNPKSQVLKSKIWTLVDNKITRSTISPHVPSYLRMCHPPPNSLSNLVTNLGIQLGTRIKLSIETLI